MADKSPVEPKAPVEPRTRTGRRGLDKVAVGAARDAANTSSRANRAKTNARTKTALLAEKDKQKALRAKQRAKQWAHLKSRAQSFARVLMVVGPIIAPMSIAWTGQIGFATGVLHWPFGGGVGYAAAYELTIVFSAWMYHEARKDGDSGWGYRLMTWTFAVGNGVQQWWHWADNWAATPRAVAYSTMTAIGVVVWEAYNRLVLRRKLRADGKLGQSRPSIELVRWIRYPRISWTAWSLSIRSNFETFDALWTAAEVERSRRISDRKIQRGLKDQLKAAEKRISELEKAASKKTPLKIEAERLDQTGPEPTPADLVSVDPGSPVVNLEQKALPPGSEDVNPGSSSPEDDAEFDPTEAEKLAVREMVEQQIPLNRTNVASYVRDNRDRLGQPEGIATKRAAQVAAWGRWNQQKAG